MSQSLVQIYIAELQIRFLTLKFNISNINWQWKWIEQNIPLIRLFASQMSGITLTPENWSILLWDFSEINLAAACEMKESDGDAYVNYYISYYSPLVRNPSEQIWLNSSAIQN